MHQSLITVLQMKLWLTHANFRVQSIVKLLCLEIVFLAASSTISTSTIKNTTNIRISHATCVTRKQTLRSLSLSYPKKNGRAWPCPSFFWYDTDFLEFESFDFIDHILLKSKKTLRSVFSWRTSNEDLISLKPAWSSMEDVPYSNTLRFNLSPESLKHKIPSIQLSGTLLHEYLNSSLE